MDADKQARIEAWKAKYNSPSLPTGEVIAMRDAPEKSRFIAEWSDGSIFSYKFYYLKNGQYGVFVVHLDGQNAVIFDSFEHARDYFLKDWERSHRESRL